GLPVVAGDQLRLALPGWTHFTTLPDLAITANPVGNVVGGTASPGDEIALSLRRGSRRADWRTVTAESGHYTVTLAPRWSLTPGDVVVAADQVDSVTDVRVAARVADLELDMSGGGVSGFARPGDRVTARLVRAGSPIAAAVGQAEEDGTYELDLQDQGLLPVAARGGDDLIIATGGQTLTVPVPQFTARLDSSSDTVTGTAPDSLAPRITLRQAAGPLAGRWIDVTTATEAGDTYVAHAPGRGVQAGTEAAVSLDWRSHRFLRRLRAPFLDAQRGGGIVAGLADPRSTLDLSVTRGGTVVTTTTLGAGADGSFVADLSQGPGAIRLAPGDAIGLRAPGVAATAAVAPVTASLRAPDRLLAGQAPADSNVFIRVADGPEADLAAGLVATADSAGTFSATLPGDGPLGAGSSAEAAVLDADGHRTHVLDVVPYIRARIGASVLTGRAPPLASLALTVRTGEREARRLLRADSRGNWGGEALVDGAAAAIIRPLDTITLSVSGGRDVTVMVPVLSAGFAPKGALAGLAPAGKDVMVELEDAGGRMVRLATRALRDGAWSVGESDLPPGAAFPLRQAVTAVAWVLVGNGHRMEARTHRGQATPTPFITSTPPASATAPATVTSTATASPTATISGTAVTPPTPGPQLWPVYLPRAATKRR
ncbi:MAG: hypothetical protein ACE5EL_06635, partial [Anaerolineae bacterium]